MTTLLHLPNEILSKILDLSRPYAFEGLALTCRHVYSVAKTFLADHNQLRRKYRYIRLVDDWTHRHLPPGTEGYYVFLHQILLDIANDPLASSYIKYADLGRRNHLRDYQDVEEGPRRSLHEQLRKNDTKDKLRYLLQTSKHLKAIGADTDEWLRRILADQNEYDEPCEFALMLLLSFLENVESLMLPDTWRSELVSEYQGDHEELDEVQLQASKLLHRLMTRANDGSVHESPLKTLRHLRPNNNVDSQYGVELISVAPFLTLESMSHVEHIHGTLMYYNIPFLSDRYPVIGPNIEKLELLNCIMDGKASAVFFNNMKKLKILKFEYSMKDDFGDDWSADLFVQHLMSALGDQLEVLSLTIGWIYSNDHPVTSLEGFTALKSLELDVELFHEWEVNDEDNPRPGPDPSDPSILEMLPDSLPSLKELCLECLAIEADVKRLDSLLRDFGSTKSLQLPNLATTKVLIEPQDNLSLRSTPDCMEHSKRARRVCEDIGDIEVSISQKVEEWEAS